jgi:hypothetical protein
MNARRVSRGLLTVAVLLSAGCTRNAVVTLTPERVPVPLRTSPRSVLFVRPSVIDSMRADRGAGLNTLHLQVGVGFADGTDALLARYFPTMQRLRVSGDGLRERQRAAALADSAGVELVVFLLPRRVSSYTTGGGTGKVGVSGALELVRRVDGRAWYIEGQGEGGSMWAGKQGRAATDASAKAIVQFHIGLHPIIDSL